VEILPIGVVILGLPLANSENGFIAVQTGALKATLDVKDCPSPRARITGHQAAGLVERFALRLLRELGLGSCIMGELSAESLAIDASVYAAGTAAVFLSIARSHGEEPRIYELLEYASMLDEQAEGSWQGVVSTLRLLALQGGAVVYRNLDEYAQLSERPPGLEIVVRASHKVGGQKHSEHDLGPDLYGAIIRTIGVLVLEGAVRLREGESIAPLLGLQKAIASYIWAYNGEGPPSPGLPGTFYELGVG